MKSITNSADSGIRNLPTEITMKIKQSLVAIALTLATFSAHAGQTSYFIYDESGHVIGEYDANGNPVQEHIYLGDRPVAVAVTNSGTTAIDYVSTDQLNTPRQVTDSGQAVLWSWNSDPFGNGAPTGSLTYNLRFPGQYYDAETGHNYNYARDYDPSVSRYLEADPIGLKAGINRYIYVNDNALRWSDRFGLCPDCKKGCETAYQKDIDDIHEELDSQLAGCAAGEIDDMSYCFGVAEATTSAALILADERRKQCLKKCGN
jgi:RHS repeat-associated protein